MKTDVILGTLTVLAAAAISAYRFVTAAGAVPAAGAWCPGVSATSAAAGEAVGVVFAGIKLVEAGAAVSAGAAVQTDNAGRAITLDAGIGLGRALDAATAAGQFIRVKLA